MRRCCSPTTPCLSPAASHKATSPRPRPSGTVPPRCATCPCWRDGIWSAGPAPRRSPKRRGHRRYLQRRLHLGCHQPALPLLQPVAAGETSTRSRIWSWATRCEIRVASPGGALWPQTRSDGPRTVSLRTGFNLVTWTGPDATPVGVAIAGLGPAMETLLLWDAASQRFRSFSPDVPSVLNTVTALNYGDAMWLLVNRTATWRQPAP